jgi:MmpS family membrane protein
VEAVTEFDHGGRFDHGGKFDHGGNDDRRAMPPADPWLETAPTSPIDLNAADVRTSVDHTPVDPFSNDDAAPRRGRRGWLVALPAFIAVACVGGTLLSPLNPFGDDDRDTTDRAGGPTTGPTAASTFGGAADRPLEHSTTLPAPRRTASYPVVVDSPAGPAGEVVYELTAGGARNVGSVAYTDQDGDIIRDGAVTLPWRVTFRMVGRKKPLVLVAQRKKGGTGPVTCTITLGGKVLSTDTETGRYAAPQCSG